MYVATMHYLMIFEYDCVLLCMEVGVLTETRRNRLALKCQRLGVIFTVVVMYLVVLGTVEFDKLIL